MKTPRQLHHRIDPISTVHTAIRWTRCDMCAFGLSITLEVSAKRLIALHRHFEPAQSAG
jgi:hypothetical protein